MHHDCVCKWDFKDGFLDPLVETERGGAGKKERGLQKEFSPPAPSPMTGSF